MRSRFALAALASALATLVVAAQLAVSGAASPPDLAGDMGGKAEHCAIAVGMIGGGILGMVTNPALGAAPDRCEPGDWTLVAANTTGDAQLSQFNNPTLTAITMVTASPHYLYVGFDSTSGVQVFRTANAAASTAADFEGEAGCSAAMHPTSCAGLGGNGVGAATSTTILDGKALTFGTFAMLWLTVGDATNALRLVVIP